MSFLRKFDAVDPRKISETIYSANSTAVKNVLQKKKVLDLVDFAVLLSPAAESHLEEVAQRSAELTRKRFGKTIQLYAPLYLSNECQNICTYCGFSYHNQVPRKTLSDEEILREAQILRNRGFEHVLLLTGEAQRKVGVEYLENAIRLVRPLFAQVSLEVQPLETSDYVRLGKVGVHGVYVYQETYDRESYAKYHPKGRKANMRFRLETPDRVGSAEVHKIGLGALLGLSDWRVDSWFVALHLNYLRKKYWRTKYSISFPRLRPAEGVQAERGKLLTEKQLLQLICAYRLYDENVELSLSTRERPAFRDQVFPFGVTTLSAGSVTEPGGYATQGSALEQFAISDERSPQLVAEEIRARGFDIIWKDWDLGFELPEEQTLDLSTASGML